MNKLTLLTTALFINGMAFSQLSPTKLSVFSNGTFFEQKEGKLSFTGNTAYVNLPGTILTGTFWLAGDNAIKVKQVDVAIDTVKKVKNAQFLDDFLQGNQGKNISMRFNQPNQNGTANALRTLTGTLASFNKQTGLIKLKTIEGKVVLINIQNLSDIDLDANANDTFKDDTLIRRAKIVIDKNIPEVPFNQVSVQMGLQWQPSYYVKLDNDKEARLIMKATVENGTEVDYDKIDLDLVVGSPQLFFGQQVDPVSDFYIPVPDATGYAYTWDYEGKDEDGDSYRGASKNFRREYKPAEQTLKMDVLGKLYDTSKTSGIIGGAYNVTVTDQNGAVFEPALDITADKDYSSAGQKSADLYYYHAGKVSLTKGAKTLLPISQSTIKYKHVYEAAIGDITNYSANRTVLNDELKPIDVFHSLKLTNTTGAPLTEASIFVVNENEDPIAQDLLNYTAVNEEASVKLSKAIDVSVKTKEEEKGRDEKAKKFNKKSYDKVTLKGTLDIANFLDKPITLNLKKALRGEVVKVDGGTVTKPGRYLAINPVSLIKWDVELKAGEKKTIVYEYEVHVTP